MTTDPTDPVSVTDYSDGAHDESPLELEASTSTPARPPEPSEDGDGFTITEAATAYGVSVSTVRRLLKAGKIPGARKIPGPKGEEYRIPADALGSLGYSMTTHPTATVIGARADAEVEDLRRRLAEAEARADRLALERDAKAREVELLTGSVEDLRSALRKLPDALPPAPQDARRRWWKRSEKPQTAPPSP